MIFLKQSDYEKMLAYGFNHRPEEACGLLAGRETPAGRYVEQVYFLENEDHSREHFTMSPQAQLRAIQDMRKQGWKPLGNFHTHPETPARPSKEDKRLARDPGASYLILSLMDDTNPVLHGFRIRQETAQQEPIKLVEDGNV
jgi:proteasome lid subunit RPN8/RPN11